MDYNELVEKLAGEILDECIEKEAKPREKRIDAYTNYFLNDPLSSGKLDRQIDRANLRAERAKLYTDLKNTPKEERDSVRNAISDNKRKRNSLVWQGVKDDLNPVKNVKSLINGVKATVDGAPHNILIGATPGQYYDTQAARVLAVQKRLQEKAASYYEESQMMKQAAEEAFAEASAIEDAAIEVLAEMGYFD